MESEKYFMSVLYNTASLPTRKVYSWPLFCFLSFVFPLLQFYSVLFLILILITTYVETWKLEKPWGWWWCLYTSCISALILFVISPVGVLHWLSYVKIKTFNLSAEDMHSRMNENDSNVTWRQCSQLCNFYQLLQALLWKPGLFVSPLPHEVLPLFAGVFLCLYGLLLQYFYGLSFLAMWAQIEGLLALKMAVISLWLWVMDPVPSGKAWLRHGSLSSAHSAVILGLGRSSLNSRR